MSFPEDPSAPRISTVERRPNPRPLWNRVERLVLVFSIITSIAGIYLAIRSLQISEISYKASVKQFIENSKSSAIQFDTVTNILSNYQKVSKDILEISRLQLQGSREMINQIAVLTTPKLYIENASIESPESGTNNNFNLFMSILINNVGRETVVLLNAEALFVSSRKVVGAQQLSDLNYQMRNEYVLTFRTKNSLFINDVYVIYLTYKDLYTNKIISKAFYFKQSNLEQKENEDTFNPWLRPNDEGGNWASNGIKKPTLLSNSCTSVEVLNANIAIEEFRTKYPNYKFYSAN